MDTAETAATYLEQTHWCTRRTHELETNDIKRAHFVPGEFRTQHFETPWPTFETGHVVSYMGARQQSHNSLSIFILLSPFFSVLNQFH